MRPLPIQLLITDLDNTLYDWVSFYAEALLALVGEAARLLDTSRDTIMEELRVVHQRFGTMERPYALLDTELVARRYPDQTLRQRATLLAPAFHAWDRARLRALRMYPGTRETLERLNRHCVLVAHTESSAFNATWRLRTLGISGLFRRVYVAMDQDIFDPFPPEQNSSELTDTIELLLPVQRKPDPEIVRNICRDFAVDPARCAYVGDSLPRDITMAKEAGAYAIWARYGTHHDAFSWNQVLRVSHWKEQDFARDERARHALRHMQPDVVIDSFADLLQILDFL
jgi:FMN phosphatase YigB (HAD superfamily)